MASGAPEQEVIEKIDIGGIALLRAAAKNYRDVLVVSSRDQYEAVAQLLDRKPTAAPGYRRPPPLRRRRFLHDQPLRYRDSEVREPGHRNGFPEPRILSRLT